MENAQLKWNVLVVLIHAIIPMLLMGIAIIRVDSHNYVEMEVQELQVSI